MGWKDVCIWSVQGGEKTVKSPSFIVRSYQLMPKPKDQETAIKA